MGRFISQTNQRTARSLRNRATGQHRTRGESVGLETALSHIDELDAVIEPILSAAKIPGAAMAVVVKGETVFAKGYGYRDREARLPATSDTPYAIGSTTKSFNATLLGILVDEGRLAWDTPVQTYLTSFRLWDPIVSTQVTVRDLVSMRTGLPRHDWLWIENPITRAELVERLRNLECSAGFRERFQYNNLTVTAAGYLAEVITGRNWEDLVREKLLAPLRMSSTGFALPKEDKVTLSYHENRRRELVLRRRFTTDVVAPAGGSMHSTVKDMALWLLFNLRGGKQEGRALIEPQTLAEIHSPQVAARTDPSCPTPQAAYAMGWFVDTYHGRLRISHGGNLHDVNSEVMLFPQDDTGIVSFTNFGGPRMAKLINQYAFDFLMGFAPDQTVEEKLAEYEKNIADIREKNALAGRVGNTAPSHRLDDYAGSYLHPGYGRIEIHRRGQGLDLQRNGLTLALEHWHYDAWAVAENDLFEIHRPHAFDRTSRILFETDANGEIAAFTIPLEPAVAPVRFAKQEVVFK
jgi:CubicO group peptidase (beta-lactamase class C family)